MSQQEPQASPNPATATANRLPRPKWCFVLLGIPTFYLFLATVMTITMLVALAFAKPDLPLQSWAYYPALAGLGVMFALWPIYILWALLTKILTWDRKIGWIVAIVFLGPVAMPILFVYMVGRYFGRYGPAKPNPRTERALDDLLSKCGSSRASLTEKQLDILRNDCRRRTVAKWNLVVTTLLGAFMLYMGFVWMPGKIEPILSFLVPSKVIIIDRASQTTKTMGGDEESIQQWTKIVMMMCGMMWMIRLGAAIMLGFAIGSALTIWVRSPVVEFLKASGKLGPGK